MLFDTLLYVIIELKSTVNIYTQVKNAINFVCETGIVRIITKRSSFSDYTFIERSETGAKPLVR